MPIGTRITSLERSAAAHAPSKLCGVCGDPMDLAKPSTGRVHISFEMAGPDYCPGCGRKQVYRMTHDHPRKLPCV